jgi:hypothetical protein
MSKRDQRKPGVIFIFDCNSIASMATVNIDKQLYELRGVFPNATRDDFYTLDNGNTAAAVTYTPEDYSKPNFDVLIEFTYDFPDAPPNAWVVDPDIQKGTGHVYGRDEHGDTKICYIYPDQWQPKWTAWDAGIMIQTWIYAYCNWLDTGNWDWKEAPHNLTEEILDGLSSVFG